MPTPAAPAQQPDPLLERGISLHRQGKLPEAKALYEARLAQQPDDPIALHLLGVIACQSKQYQLAVTLIDQAIRIQPDFADAYSNRGNALRELAQFDAAIDSFAQAIKCNPDHADAFYNRGLTLARLGRYADAVASYQMAIGIRPGYANAHANCAVALQALGQLDAAIDRYDQAIALDPRHAEAWSSRGVALKLLGQLDAAIDSFDHAIAVRPGFAGAWSNRGNALMLNGQLDAAIESFTHAIGLQPDYAEAHFNLGNALRQSQQPGAALASYERAVALRPGYVDAHANRGVVLKELGRIDAAIASFDMALQLDAGNAGIHFNRGNAFKEVNQLDAAIASYDSAIAIEPAYAEALWNKALALLLGGDLQPGWALYEWRWKHTSGESYPHRRDFHQPLWLGGEPLDGKTILLHSEQGLGDTLQFCRYARLVKARGARVVMEVPAALLSVLQGLAGVDVLVEKGGPLPEFDVHCPLLSLPLALGTDAATIPEPHAYLRSDAARVEAWRARLGVPRKPRVGLVWSGGPGLRNDRQRSLSLATLVPHLPDRFEYVCLQKEVRDSDVPILQQSGIRFVGADIMDFADTAALCDLMDVVVSVDTSVAHLAGALGRPGCVLLPFVPDWRWQLARDDSPWYASLILYRQGADRDWNPVLERLMQALLADARLAPCLPPERFDQLLEQAVLLHQQGKLAEARPIYESIMREEPAHPVAMHLLGVMAFQAGQFETAVALIGKAISIAPDYADAHSNLGNALRELQQFEAAVASFDRAIALEPEHADAYANRGIALKELDQIDAALASYGNAIRLKPGDAGVYFNRGNAFHARNELAAAIADYDEALRIVPDHADAAWNKSHALLLGGQLERGWPLYEWRWKNPRSACYRLQRHFPQPLWLGADSLAGKTILLHGEQGLGDAIQFCRYARLVKARGARVILEVAPSLLALLEGLDGVDDLVARGAALPAFDVHCPLLSLPLALATGLDSIPSPQAYLSSKAAKVEVWKERLGQSGKPRVGLVWSGGTALAGDRRRSLTLAALLPFLPDGLDYVCLQKEIRAVDSEAYRQSGIRDCSADLQDFSDTAALCSLMDVVISVDTSVAHLAAALGRPTWVMLPFAPDWRWMLARDDSPWYRTMRLFRQGQDKQWDGVLAAVARALREQFLHG